MKRSDLYIKVTTAALFIAVVCYIGFSAYNIFGTSYETVAAITVTVEDTGDTEGWIVREERVVSGGGAGASPLARDGEKVSVGHLIAIEYQNGDALRRAGELRELRLKIEQLESAASAGTVQSVTSAADSVEALSKALQDSRLTNLDAALIRVESYILTGSSALTIADLPALKLQLAELEQQSAGDAVVRAPVSGVYSHVVDGYEGVKPEMLSGLTPSGLSELFSVPEGGVTENAGKLVTGIRWYYAITIDLSDTKRLSVDKEVQVRFKGGYQSVVTMTVESVGRAEDGKCIIILSSASAIADVAGVRFAESELVYETHTGIRVPKEAIHLGDDGKTYVYLQTGAQAERAEVTILTEFGDSYLAINAGPEPLLREGARIIKKANDLTSGKVVIS